jgi:hypothetical protein
MSYCVCVCACCVCVCAAYVQSQLSLTAQHREFSISFFLHIQVTRIGQNRIYIIHAVYDRKFDDSPAKNTVHAPYIYSWPKPYMHTVYDRIFDDFPARNTAYTP